jgi:DNA-binding MarR family transcriptional regulator
MLAVPQADASLSMAELGEHVGLSQSQLWRRLERLESEGYIVRRARSAARSMNSVTFKAQFRGSKLF